MNRPRQVLEMKLTQVVKLEFAQIGDYSQKGRRHHNAARGSFVEIGGKLQPAPAPRFSGTPASVPEPPAEPGADTERALSAWGLGAAEIARLAGVRD